MGPDPDSWTDLDDAARAFSGTGSYRVEFTVDAATASADRLLVGLGQVGDIARVRVNGTDCGIAWTAPSEVDVTAAVREGRNVLDVEVTTPWRNRLIGEASAPTKEIFAPMAAVYEPTAMPLPADSRARCSLSHNARTADDQHRISPPFAVHQQSLCRNSAYVCHPGCAATGRASTRSGDNDVMKGLTCHSNPSHGTSGGRFSRSPSRAPFSSPAAPEEAATRAIQAATPATRRRPDSR